ncbi:hypothetical protein [Oceanobacillus sp. 1P07AA]|uniref:hypothetical protein n=1 Tax=Oceanobacillus sp. 1P07AA TaxID=3132293 RepID=UPI0039A51060
MVSRKVIIALFLFGYVYAIVRDILFNQPIDIIAVILIDPFLLLLSIVIAHKLVDAVSGTASFHIRKQSIIIYIVCFSVSIGLYAVIYQSLQTTFG